MSDRTKGHVRLEPCGTYDLLSLDGVIDIELATDLHEAATRMRASGRDGVLDAGEAEYLDASALQLLIALQQALSSTGRTLRVQRISDPARQGCERAAAWPALEGGGER